MSNPRPSKKKMNHRKFLAIWIPIVTILLSVVIVVDIVCYSMPHVIDNYLGKGAMHISTGEGAENWDAEYNKKNPAYTGGNSIKAATAKAREIANEGIVLMKNGDGTAPFLPLEEGSKVTPFGFGYLYPVYSDLGSAATADVDLSVFAVIGRQGLSYTSSESVDLETAISSTFQVNQAVVDQMKGATVHLTSAAPGTTECKAVGIVSFQGGNTHLYEYEPSIYNGLETSCTDTVGLVFISRDSGENGDLKTDAYEDGTPHQLALSRDEKGMIAFAKKNCTKGVVAIINTCNMMELGPLFEGEYAVDAVVWIGYPGHIGSQSLADILCGKVNPSGRTADTWPADLTQDPTYVNFGNFHYTNSATVDGENASETIPTSFVEYEEGVYLGYKFYETADVEDPNFDYDSRVVVPFGYGLSYSKFKQEIESFDVHDDTVEMAVKVTNIGEKTGKDVVEVYYTPPYTEFDKANHIEKPVVNLVAFEKTKDIEPGQSEIIHISFLKEEMASYSFTHDNGDGTTGCYMLEEGDYQISIRSDSHNVLDEKTVKIDNTIWYTNANPRQTEKDGQSELDDNGVPLNYPQSQISDPNATYIAATNQFDDVTSYMFSGKVTNLSRANWTESFPTRPDSEDCIADEAVTYIVDHYSYNTFDPNTDPLYGNVEGSRVYKTTAPVEKANNGMILSSLRGLSYYDKAWDLLLDQVDYSSPEIATLLYTQPNAALTSIGLPAVRNVEGPNGFGLVFKFYLGGLTGSTVSETCTYPAPMVLASTWNKQLAYGMGEAIGQEALNITVDGEPVTVASINGPAMNVHRSAFSGRNSEYYSEDPVLSGYIGLNEITGAANQGLYMNFKHFVMNDQETNRHGVCTWATEQAMREAYFKTFELVFKYARRTINYISDMEGTLSTKTMRGATAVMTSMNRIGAMPAGNNYELLQNVLRGEWGFNGLIGTDMPSQSNEDLMIRTGGDIKLATAVVTAEDLSSPTAKWCIRNAIHNIAYCVVNSSAMNGVVPGSIVTYDISPWKLILNVVNVVVFAFSALMVAYIILRTIQHKKNPDQFSKGKRDSAGLDQRRPD